VAAPAAVNRISVPGRPGYAFPDCLYEEVPVAGPWEQMVYHNPMRASDADRERAVEALKAGYHEGLLTSAELDARTGQVVLAGTYAELTAATAVLAARPLAGVPAGKRLTPKVVAGGACAIVLPAVLVAAFLSFYGGFIVLFVLACVGLFVSAAPVSQRRPDPPF
jgi:hypothetical protein